MLRHMSWGDKGNASIMHDKKAKDTLSTLDAFCRVSHIRLQTSETPYLIGFWVIFCLFVFFCPSLPPSNSHLWSWNSEG